MKKDVGKTIFRVCISRCVYCLRYQTCLDGVLYRCFGNFKVLSEGNIGLKLVKATNAFNFSH